MSERRTIRRYAHEMYPHAEEGETRALAVEVPYLYAKAVGLDVWGTGWDDDKTDAGRDRGILRRPVPRERDVVGGEPATDRGVDGSGV